MNKINIEIRFKIAVALTILAFILGIVFAEPLPEEKGINLQLGVGLAMIAAIFGFSILPTIIYELSGPNRRLYLICGSLGLSFIKLSVKVFTSDSGITIQEKHKLGKYMQKEYGTSINEPLTEYLRQNNDFRDNLDSVCKIMLELKISERMDVLFRLFLLCMDDRVYNENEEYALKEIAKALKIGEKRFNIVKKSALKEKGFQSKEQQEQAKQKQSWNFYQMDQLLKMTYNPYLVLGVEQHAANDEVKRAYRNLVKKYHPDKSMMENEDTRKQDSLKILEINEAYEYIKKMRGIK